MPPSNRPSSLASSKSPVTAEADSAPPAGLPVGAVEERSGGGLLLVTEPPPVEGGRLAGRPPLARFIESITTTAAAAPRLPQPKAGSRRSSSVRGSEVPHVRVVAT